MMGNGWGMGAGGWIFMLMFWGVLIALIVWAVTQLLPTSRTGEPDRREPADTPEAILDRRFAAGDIDVEEYQRASDELAARRGERR